MFIFFDGILINQNSVAEIKRVVLTADKEAEKPWTIELIRAMQPPIIEYYLTKDSMNKRFYELKENVGCASDRG